MIPLVLLILLAALCAVLVLRAIRVKTGPAGERRTFPEAEQRADAYAQKLADMVRIPTVTGNTPAFEELLALMRRQFPILFERAELHEFDSSLLLRLPSENSALPAVLLMGHQDVVPASAEGWRYPPFDGVIAEGRVWGRGAFDCKATIFCELQAVEELLASGAALPRDLYLAMSANEETGGPGAPAIVRYLRENGVELAIALDEGSVIVSEGVPGMDRPYAPIGVMEKGVVNVRFTAHSSGGHASQPPRGTPIARLAAFVNGLEKDRPFRRRMSPVVERSLVDMAAILPFGMRLLFGNIWLFRPLLNRLLPGLSPMFDAWFGTTFCFTMCQGGEAANIIPQEASVHCNLRISDQQGMEETLEILRRRAEREGLEMEVVSGYDATRPSDTEGKVWQRLCAVISEIYPDVGMGPYLLTGGTDCRHFEALTENAFRITPLRIDGQQLEAVHGIDENISCLTLVETVEFYKAIATAFGED